MRIGFTTNRTIITLLFALAAVACDGTKPPTEPPPPPPPGDTTPPSIVSVTPNNGAIGVAKDAKIRIEFSEPMNRQATELAYQSADMPAVSFTWFSNDTKLEIDPVSDLEYTNTGKLYNFKLKNTATDVAGNALAAFGSSFTTFKELTRKLISDDALNGFVRGDGFVDTTHDVVAGDSSVTDNAQLKGFFGFDLSSLETDGLTVPDNIASATLRVNQFGVRGSPYTDLILGNKHLLAAHVDYGAVLNFNDFNTPILHDLGDLSTDASLGYKTNSNALESVKDDWTNRTTRKNRSQFMLFFPKTTDGDGITDDVRLGSRAGANPPELTVTFLVP